MVYLLTGSAGFIGQKTALELLKQGHEVIGIDNLNDYYDPELKEFRLGELRKHSSFKFFHGSIQDINFVESLFKNHKFEAVINLAAMAGVRYSQKYPKLYFETNVDGTLVLLELMQKYKVKKKILASTSSLYAGQKLPFSEELPVNQPLSPYAASKKAAEVLCYTFHHLYGIDVTVFRFFTVYGPAGRPDMSVYRFIQAIDQGKPLTLFGDGSQARDFTFVDDIARGVVAGLPLTGYEVVNLGGGKNPISVKAMIEMIENILGKKAIIEYKPFNKADMKETWAEISKAKKLLNWEPYTNLEEGLKKSISWYLENKKMILNFNNKNVD